MKRRGLQVGICAGPVTGAADPMDSGSAHGGGTAQGEGTSRVKLAKRPVAWGKTCAIGPTDVWPRRAGVRGRPFAPGLRGAPDDPLLGAPLASFGG